jgi:AcrR family transcriptional regulator
MSTSTRRYHHGDLRQVLLAEGMKLVNETGPDHVSLRELARRAGVSPMAPYRHYPDKDSLLAAIAAEGFRRLARQLALETDASAPARSPLLQCGLAYVRFALAQPALFRLMFGARQFKGDHPDLGEARAASFDVLMRHLDAGGEPERRAARARGCWSLVHGLALLLLDGLMQVPETGPEDAWLAHIISSTVAGEPPAGARLP